MRELSTHSESDKEIMNKIGKSFEIGECIKSMEIGKTYLIEKNDFIYYKNTRHLFHKMAKKIGASVKTKSVDAGIAVKRIS